MHDLEIIDNRASMAYTGNVPWHGLGTRVPSNLTPTEMLKAANLDWRVEKVPLYGKIGGVEVRSSKSFLVRLSDNKVLDEVSEDWNEIQNQEAFEFFNDFITAGEMEMHTAGSLHGGQIVWALAKIKESFELFGEDKIDSFLLFTNFHRYGFSTDVRFTLVRVVCANTHIEALNSQIDKAVNISHRTKFEPDAAKLMLGVAAHRLESYKAQAKFLSERRYTEESVNDFFRTIFPVTGDGKHKKEISSNAILAKEIIHTQPGHEYGEGTWWQPYNAATYMIDHVVGRSADTRLASAWYGANKKLKIKALDTAVIMAVAA